MIIKLDKDTLIRWESCSGCHYDEAKDITLFFIGKHTTLSSKGNWVRFIPSAVAKGAIWTDGKTIKLRQ